MAAANVSGAPDGGTEPDLPRWDPTLPELVTDPYPVYRRLREDNPVHRSPLGAWVLTRYADVAAVLRDPRSGRAGYRDLTRAFLGVGPMQRSFDKWMLFQDPPDHTRLRALTSKAFTPRVVEGLRPRIEQLVDGLLDDVQDVRSMDLLAQVAQPLPVLVICELLGVPDEDHGRFHHWSFALALALDMAVATPTIVEAGNEAAQGLTDYFRDLVRERRGSPRAGTC